MKKLWLLLLLFVVGCGEPAIVKNIQKIVCHGRDHFTVFIQDGKLYKTITIDNVQFIQDAPLGTTCWADTFRMTDEIYNGGTIHIHSLADIVIGSAPPD